MGGYNIANNVSQYPNQHPDQHAIVFDPNNTDRVITGHDGGLSVTNDIRAVPATWTDVNNGYNVTQFYTVALQDSENSNLIVGGTQDNGSPFFTFDLSGQSISPSEDLSSGDGAYAYLGDSFGYVSSQLGRVMRLKYLSDGTLTSPRTAPVGEWSVIKPIGSEGHLFITPFVVDPSNEEIIYYLAGSALWRNNQLSAIANFQDSTSTGWSELTDLTPGNLLTTLEVSTTNPSHRLYYAAFSGSSAPLVYRLDNADTATDGEVNISIPGAASGSYIHDIEINPNNADELIVLMSNYNILGLYHSVDAGANWTAIEGNLQNDGVNPGPSLRNAEIITLNGKTHYLVGASTGLFQTTSLNGNSTQWEPAATDKIGNVPVEFIASRSDGLIAAATHGRGIFTGQPGREITVGDNGGNQGWRMLSAPVKQFSASKLKGAPVQGLVRGPDEGDDANMFVFDKQATPQFRAPEFDESIGEGHGFIMFFFDNTINNAELLPNLLQAPGEEPAQNVQVALNDQNFTLVGNPFAANLHTTDGITIDAGVQSTIHIWDDQTGSYNNSAFVGGNQVISEWQGFFIESTGNNQKLTFNAAGKTEDQPDFALFKTEHSENQIDRREIAFQLEGPENTLDQAIRFCFDKESHSGWDKHDAQKLFPITQNRFITLSITNPNIDAEKQLSKDCRSLNPEEPQEYFLHFDARNVNGTFVLSWPEMAEIPDHWNLLLYNEADGIPIDLNNRSRYQFTAKATQTNKQKALSSPKKASLKLKSLYSKPMFRLVVDPQTAVNTEENLLTIPKELKLSQNFPNPFNPSTSISFELPRRSHVQLVVYDVSGHEVMQLADQVFPAGVHSRSFDASRLASGVYIYRLQTAERVLTKKMTLIK